MTLRRLTVPFGSSRLEETFTFGCWRAASCYEPSRKVTRLSADGPPLALPFISCVPSGFVMPAGSGLLIRGLEEGDNIGGTRLARAIISLPSTPIGFSTRSEALTAQ